MCHEVVNFGFSQIATERFTEILSRAYLFEDQRGTGAIAVNQTGDVRLGKKWMAPMKLLHEGSHSFGRHVPARQDRAGRPGIADRKIGGETRQRRLCEPAIGGELSAV